MYMYIVYMFIFYISIYVYTQFLITPREKFSQTFIKHSSKRDYKIPFSSCVKIDLWDGPWWRQEEHPYHLSSDTLQVQCHKATGGSRCVLKVWGRGELNREVTTSWSVLDFLLPEDILVKPSHRDSPER